MRVGADPLTCLRHPEQSQEGPGQRPTPARATHLGTAGRRWRGGSGQGARSPGGRGPYVARSLGAEPGSGPGALPSTPRASASVFALGEGPEQEGRERRKEPWPWGPETQDPRPSASGNPQGEGCWRPLQMAKPPQEGTSGSSLAAAPASLHRVGGSALRRALGTWGRPRGGPRGAAHPLSCPRSGERLRGRGQCCWPAGGLGPCAAGGGLAGCGGRAPGLRGVGGARRRLCAPCKSLGPSLSSSSTSRGDGASGVDTASAAPAQRPWSQPSRGSQRGARGPHLPPEAAC